MNKFIIAVVCMLMLTQAFAFKLKSTSEHHGLSRLQGDNFLERPLSRDAMRLREGFRLPAMRAAASPEIRQADPDSDGYGPVQFANAPVHR